MSEIIARAPTRVDIAGGTLDISPLSQILQNKVTVNFAVTLFAEVKVTSVHTGKGYKIVSEDQGVTVEGDFDQVCRTDKLPLIGQMLKGVWHRELPAVHIQTKAGSPAGAGLGGSSALAVALMGALLELKRQTVSSPALKDEEFIRLVQDIETAVIRVPTGCQDYWGAMLGGINVLTYPPGGTVVKKIKSIDMSVLQKNLVLCFSGQSRASGMNNWAIFKKAFDGDRDLLVSLNKIGEIAQQAADAIAVGDWAAVWHHSHKEWELRKSLWPEISTPHTDKLEKVAMENGALLSRVCGAGGGGVMAFIVDETNKAHLTQQLNQAGGRVLEAGLAVEGLRIQINN